MDMGNHGLAYWPYCKKTLAAPSTLSMAQTFLPISHRRHRQPSSQCTGMVSIHTTFWGWHPIREPVLLPIQTSANVLGWESSTGQPMCLGACIHVRHPEKGLGSWLQPFLRTAAKADEMGERYTPHYEPHCTMACALSARLPF